LKTEKKVPLVDVDVRGAVSLKTPFEGGRKMRLGMMGGG